MKSLVINILKSIGEWGCIVVKLDHSNIYDIFFKQLIIYVIQLSILTLHDELKARVQQER